MNDGVGKMIFVMHICLKKLRDISFVLFVCLCWSFTAQSTTRSCRAGQLIVALFLGRLRPSKRLNSIKTRASSVVTDNYCWDLTAETTTVQSFSAVSQKKGHSKGNFKIGEKYQF